MIRETLLRNGEKPVMIPLGRLAKPYVILVRETLKKPTHFCLGGNDMLTLGAQVKKYVTFNLMSNSNITWNDINWIQTQEYVRKLQHRIYKARLKGNIGQVHWLQNHFINSMGAKLIAVRQVTNLNKGRNPPDIDGLIIITSEQKLEMARNLKLDGQALPIRITWIPKPGEIEKRPLGIPVIRDRAKQALAKLALEPEWEAIFEANSYGFRPGRNAHDAIEAIFLSLHHNRQQFVYNADIRKDFDKINHEAFLTKLNTFPIMKKQIAAWLKSQVMEGYANNPKYGLPISTEGTLQSGVISPLLANIALHGLENHLKEFVGNLPYKAYPTAGHHKSVKSKAISVIRYADDFVIIHSNREILELCVAKVKKWLEHVGLTINEEKSSIKDCQNGFLFLGFQIIQVMNKSRDKSKVKIQPSKQSQIKFLSKIRTIIENNKAISSYQLIMILRPIIIGWGNYFKYCECKQVFTKLSHYIGQKLRAWVFRRDHRNGRLYVKQKYFPSGRTYTFDGQLHKDDWVLVGSQKIKDGKYIYLPQLVWIRRQKYVKAKGTDSPFSRSHYWALRTSKQSPYPIRIRELLLRQKQICPICKQKFTTLDTSTWEVDHIIPKYLGGKYIYKNLQLLHKECHLKKTQDDLLTYKPNNKN